MAGVEHTLDFAGHRALVTGATGGIGAAIVDILTARGAPVVACDARKAEATSSWFVLLNVRDQASVIQAFDRAENLLGGVCDILVNAAGLYPSDPLIEMTEEAWDRVLDTNLKGAFLTSQQFCRRLVAADRAGCIVNITSGSADRARVGAAHYSASKAALEMLTRSFALEFASQRIRVNAVSPGYVQVGSAVNPLSTAYVEAITRTIPLARAGTPRDVARVVAFLCEDASDWITGASYRVDGGSHAGTLALPLSRD
ncbi:SDR family oxidoreductase [bacterium]|nr:MAG: SDR family oxidoreductase [bacterium]